MQQKPRPYKEKTELVGPGNCHTRFEVPTQQKMDLHFEPETAQATRRTTATMASAHRPDTNEARRVPGDTGGLFVGRDPRLHYPYPHPPSRYHPGTAKQYPIHDDSSAQQHSDTPKNNTGKTFQHERQQFLRDNKWLVNDGLGTSQLENTHTDDPQTSGGDGTKKTIDTDPSPRLPDGTGRGPTHPSSKHVLTLPPGLRSKDPDGRGRTISPRRATEADTTDEAQQSPMV